MKKSKTDDVIEESAKALIGMRLDKRDSDPPKPSKKNLERKFRMDIGAKGKPRVSEVK